MLNLTKKTISPLNSKIWVSSVPNLSLTNNAFISDGKIWRQFCFGPRQLIWTSRYQYIVRLMTFKLQPGRDVKNRLHQKLVNRENVTISTLYYLPSKVDLISETSKKICKSTFQVKSFYFYFCVLTVQSVDAFCSSYKTSQYISKYTYIDI